jgi:hypothetical protein
MMRIRSPSKLALTACLPIASWFLSPGDAQQSTLIQHCGYVVPGSKYLTFWRAESFSMVALWWYAYKLFRHWMIPGR